MPNDLGDVDLVSDDHDDTRPLLGRRRFPTSSKADGIDTWWKNTLHTNWWRLKVIIMSTLVALLLQLLWLCVLSSGLNHPNEPEEITLPSYNLPDNVAHKLGMYGPRYPVENFGTYPSIPRNLPADCSITLVNSLHRHGARHPTPKYKGLILQSLEKAKLIASRHPVKDPKLEFVKTYNVELDANFLVPFGQKQSYLSGRLIAATYPDLAAGGAFIRGTTKDRVAESSRWFKQGLEDKPFSVRKTDLVDPNLLIAVGPDMNNTLSVKSCKATKYEGTEKKWLSVYGPPIAERLNKAFGLPSEGSEHEGRFLKLDETDVVLLMSLCGFETALKNGVKSPWCDVFTEEEWEANEYFYDVMKYYRDGPGSLVSRSEGSGWVNELISRLTGQPVRYAGPINTTLDSNPETFPIPPKSPRIFSDFSSDDNIVRIISALGILRGEKRLDPFGPPRKNRLWTTSKIVPFAGTLVVEKLSCGQHPHSIPTRDLRSPEVNTGNHDYVRLILNDAVVPLDWKECGDLGRRSGLCELNAFLKTQKYSLDGGSWERWCSGGDNGDDDEGDESF